MEEAKLEQLSEESLLSDRSYLSNLLLRTFTKLHAIHPFANKHSPCAHVLVDPGDSYALNPDINKSSSKPLLASALVSKIKLSVEANRPLIE